MSGPRWAAPRPGRPWPRLLVLLAVALPAGSGASLEAQRAPGEQAGPTGPRDPVRLEAFIDGLMAAHLDERDIAGAVVAVVRGDEVLLAKGYGYANLERRAPVDPARTLFRIGSVTKLFTWTAVMQLVEAGRLDLDRDVNEYIDFEIPDPYDEPITLHHLLTHTAGFEERAVGLFSTSEEPRGQWLAENMPGRVRPPGVVSAYSNYGTALAGHIVERVSGLSWEAYVEERILQPLGMRHTTARQPLPEHLEADMSVGYANAGGRLEPRPFETLIPVAPAGSISSTGEDMARFMIAHLQHGRYGQASILEEETARWMHQRVFSHDERLNSFALGFYEKGRPDLRVIGHGGDTQWFHTDLALIPDDGVGVFVSYNTEAGGALSFGRFLRLFIEHHYPAPAPAVAEGADTIDLRPYAGSYATSRSAHTTFERILGLLMPLRVTRDPAANELVIQTGAEPMRFVALEPGLFRDTRTGTLAVFRRDDSGDVQQLFLGDAPMLAMQRLAWWESPLLHQVLLGIAALLFLSVILLVPVRYLMQRRFEEVRPLRGQERAARWMAVAVAVLNLAGLLGIGIVLSNITNLLHGDLPGLGFVLLLPVLAAALTVGLVWFAIHAWRTRMWGRWGRIHFTALTVAAILFALVLYHWNLLGWRI